MAYKQNNPFSRKASSPFNKARIAKPNVANNMKAISRKSSSPLNTHHNVEPRTGEWTIDPNDPNVRSREVITPGTQGQTFKEAGVDPEEAKQYWIENPEEYKKYIEGKKGNVETQYQDRDTINQKKLEDFYQVNIKNMERGDKKYPWDELYGKWHHTAKLYEPRSGEDYGGDIDFDFGVDQRTGEQGGNIEGKHVKSYHGDHDWHGWEKIAPGRLPYIDKDDPDIQKRWAANIRGSYNKHLRETAKEYQKNLNLSNLWKVGTGNYVPVDLTTREGRELLDQDQHNEIYYGAHNKWFKNFKTAYPEIEWKHRDREYGKGSTKTSTGPWKDRG